MRLGTVPVAVVAVVLVGGVWAIAIQTLAHPKPLTASRRAPGAIVWQDRVFSSRSQLSRWLERHGSVYRRWARLHPAAASILGGHKGAFRPPHHKVSTRTVADQSAGRRAAAQRTIAVSQSSPAYEAFVVLLLFVGATLLALGLAPPALVQRVRWTAWLSPDRRPYALMAGIALLVGCGLATSLQ